MIRPVIQSFSIYIVVSMFSASIGFLVGYLTRSLDFIVYGVLLGVFYLLVINVYAFFIYRSDKVRAEDGKWRIPERQLFLIAWMGGAIGAWLAMLKYRHKTQHASFKWGIPVILLITIGIWLSIFSIVYATGEKGKVMAEQAWMEENREAQWHSEMFK